MGKRKESGTEEDIFSGKEYCTILTYTVKHCFSTEEIRVQINSALYRGLTKRYFLTFWGKNGKVMHKFISGTKVNSQIKILHSFYALLSTLAQAPEVWN